MSFRVLPSVALGLALTGVLSGCAFQGVSSLPLPGSIGTGAESYTVEIELPDVGTLRPNAQVKVGDIAVGTVTALTTRNWHAVATVSLGKDVELPDNAVAAVGQNSLLGASYIELGPPADAAPTGRLERGEVIPLARTKAYPSTEEVLAATSVVLNGSGLGQLSTVTHELNRALGGDDGAVGRLIPRLDELVAGLDQQRADITTALDGLDRLSGQLAGQTSTISAALDQFGPTFAVLGRERDDLVTALDKLRALGVTGSAVIEESGENLTANLRDLQPVIASLADTQEHLVGALGLALTFPLPAATAPNACRGDFCNLSLTLDLQLGKIDANLLTGTPLQGTLFGVQNLLGGTAPGQAGGVADPLQAPLQALTGGGDPATGPPAEAPPSADTSPPPGEEQTDAPSGPGLLGSLLGGDR
jgi:phospholipid/cholesterol/gamma-HCH transport system substrate-binding protein